MKVTLVPFDLASLAQALRSSDAFNEFGVAAGAFPPPYILSAAQKALREGLPPMWHAPYAFVDGNVPIVVGSGGFRRAPEAARVEIGYNVAEARQRHGYATAAIAELCKIAFARTEVDEVYAETAVANVASQRVLEKNGFRNLGSRETTEDGAVYRWLKAR